MVLIVGGCEVTGFRVGG
uniref:Uncharacterized protein n=1 Tax=Arundo donax TaxID=35708 RepID=A0A0A9KSN2_ARUDO